MAQAAEHTPFVYQVPGVCPICESRTIFRAKYHWYRGHLRCEKCDFVPRERALALVLKDTVPHWRAVRIHESSPAGRGISLKMKAECTQYTASHYFPDQPRGEIVRGFRNEDLEHQTFDDDVFDIVATLDVMEHVFHPWLVYREVCRTLRPGGYYFHTFPIWNDRKLAYKARAEINDKGEVVHFEKPDFHGNPISHEGSLVTMDYVYDIHKAINEWAPLLDVRLIRFCDVEHGVLGEHTDTVICRKRQ